MCSLDGSDESLIAEGLLPGSPINILDGKVYCFESGEPMEADTSSENQQIFRMDTDGSNKELF
jgi:hypothetical protein